MAFQNIVIFAILVFAVSSTDVERHEAFTQPVATTDNNEALHQPVPTNDKEAHNQPVPTTNNNEALHQPVPTTNNNEALHQPVPTNDNNEAHNQPVQTNNNNEALHQPVPTTNNNEALHQPVPTTDNNGALHQPVPTTDNNEYVSQPRLTTSNIEAVLQPPQATGTNDDAPQFAPTSSNNEVVSQVLPTSSNNKVVSQVLPTSSNNEVVSQVLPTSSNNKVVSQDLPTSSNKKVILLPVPTTSYIVYHANIASSLSQLGHEVWVCVPHYLLKKNLIKDKSVHVLSYGEELGDITAKLFASTKIVDNFWEGNDKDSMSFTNIFKMIRDFREICIAVLSEKKFVETLNSLNASLFVLDSITSYLNMLVLPYKLDIPYALIGTMHDVVMSRVPFTPAATPFPAMAMNDNLTFRERLTTTFFFSVSYFFELFYDSSLVTRFAPEKPYVSITDLAARAEIFISEIDHILDFPRPTLPNTKLTGGSSVSSASPLEGEFQKFVDDAQNGIIVASFGGSVIDVPTHITSKIEAAFKQMNLKVIWRVNFTSSDPNQIMTSKWIPQNDLLGHEKTKLFVSHCGKNGQYEALYHGVPILCLPIYGDQPYNAERVRIKSLGLSADMRSATADDLAGLMKQILYEDKYSTNMKKASKLFREIFKVPVKEVAYWLDHVMKYGGEYMRSSCQEMPLYQFLLLDVIGFIVGIVIAVIVLLFVIIRQCCRICTRSKSVGKSKTD